MSATAPSQTVYSIGYDFHAGNGTAGNGTDNGNVYGITNYKDTTHGRDQTFTYDALNRLISAQNAGTNCATMVLGNKTEYWGNSYGYDAWGNLLQKNVTKCGAEGLTVTADAHNWIHASGTDYLYDAAGNMTRNVTPTVQTYTYDEENRLTGAAGYTYTYDGDGNRVRKSNGNLAANGTLYWYMTPGVVAESDLAGTLKSEYVFFDGERVARRDGATGAGGVFYYFSDHLKTASVITDSAGTIKAESDYYPWGGELQFVNNDSNDYKFTGKKRDLETGLDYFGARYYSNGLGRFVSADWSPTPIPVPYADFGDPQSLNQYTYVRNIPTANVDTDGHQCQGVCNDVKVNMEYVKQTLNQLKPLAPVAGPAAATVGPAALLALPSAGAMTLVVVGTKFELPEDGACGGDCTIYMLHGSANPGPDSLWDWILGKKPVQENNQSQQNQEQNKGKTEEEKKKEEPDAQTSTSGGQQGSSGRGTAGGGRDRSQQGATDQVDDITKNQEIKRRRGQGEAIRDTSKSKQNERTELKKVKSSEDVQDTETRMNEPMDSIQRLLDELEHAADFAEFSRMRVSAEPQILASRDAGLISQLGMIYRERRLWSEAEDVLRKAAKLEPSLPTPHRSLGLLFIHRDDLAWEQSLECAKESLETAARLEKKANEPSAATHTLLGRVYLSLGERSGAEEEFRMALRIDPRYTEAKYNLATSLGQLSVPANDEIISLLKQSIEDDPHYFAALRDLGWNLRSSNVLEAEYYLSRALQEAQDDVLVHIYYARLKFDTEPAIAEQQYKKAIELDPGDSELHQLLGLLYSHSGRNDEANRELFSALELDPDNEKLFAGYLDFLNKIKDRTYRAKLYQSAKRNSLLAPEMLQELDKSVASL